MADFFQTGVIATFHRLGKIDLEKIEAELSWYTNERPIALVLPSLFSELDGEALKGIIRELQGVKYIKEIVVTLGPATEEEFHSAQEFFSVLPQKTRIIWNTGPRIDALYRAIEDAELPIGEPGKGRSAWMAYGFILSEQYIHGIALHDCDILTYDRGLLARLCYPVTNPNLDYDFCKGCGICAVECPGKKGNNTVAAENPRTPPDIALFRQFPVSSCGRVLNGC